MTWASGPRRRGHCVRRGVGTSPGAESATPGTNCAPAGSERRIPPPDFGPPGSLGGPNPPRSPGIPGERLWGGHIRAWLARAVSYASLEDSGSVSGARGRTFKSPANIGTRAARNDYARRPWRVRSWQPDVCGSCAVRTQSGDSMRSRPRCRRSPESPSQRGILRAPAALSSRSLRTDNLSGRQD